MKQILLFFTFFLIAITGMADEKKNNFREKLFNAKLSEFAVKLKMSQEQMSDFKPIYRQYQQDIMNLWRKDRKMTGKPTTTAEAATHMKKQLEKQKKAQQIRIYYVDKFAKVLTAEQLMRLYYTEDQIQYKLMHRMSHSSNPNRKCHNREHFSKPNNDK